MFLLGDLKREKECVFDDVLEGDLAKLAPVSLSPTDGASLLLFKLGRIDATGATLEFVLRKECVTGEEDSAHSSPIDARKSVGDSGIITDSLLPIEPLVER